jgi:hypothetical protein
MVTCVVLFSRILLFVMLPLDSIMESKLKCKTDNKAKSCEGMTLDEKIKILDKLRSGMSASAVGLTFRIYFIFLSNFTLIFYLDA